MAAERASSPLSPMSPPPGAAPPKPTDEAAVKVLQATFVTAITAMTICNPVRPMLLLEFSGGDSAAAGAISLTFFVGFS